MKLTNISELIYEIDLDKIIKYFASFSQRFLDICEGKVPKGQMTLMRDKSLRNTNLKGEQLYYKVSFTRY